MEKEVKSKKFKIPILFLVFNRPEETKKVFEQILKINPSNIYVAADGPRENNESDRLKCKEVRSIFEEYKGDMQIRTFFRKENLGCKKAISSGIRWFFEQVEMGIIVEDDCLPDTSFFYYCEKMLHYYKDDTRIMAVSGCNKGLDINIPYDYFYSSYVQIWGWASWRRAWSKYDIEMKNWDYIKENLELYFPNKKERKIRLKYYENSLSNVINTWDYLWHLTIVINHGLAIIPKKNMIRNIGFNENSTHTNDANNKLAKLEVSSINYDLIRHPDYIVLSKEFELYHRLKTSIIKTIFIKCKVIIYQLLKIIAPCIIKKFKK